jgi:hypothetical protein
MKKNPLEQARQARTLRAQPHEWTGLCFLHFSGLLCSCLLLSACCGCGGESSTDNQDGTITDHVTERMWQKQNDVTAKTFDDATTYCEELTLAGFSDWRLPRPEELESIRGAVYFPTINTDFFPPTAPSNYWRQPTNAHSTHSAWYVGLFSYCRGNFHEGQDGLVRCVRLSQ